MAKESFEKQSKPKRTDKLLRALAFSASLLSASELSDYMRELQSVRDATEQAEASEVLNTRQNMTHILAVPSVELELDSQQYYDSRSTALSDRIPDSQARTDISLLLNPETSSSYLAFLSSRPLEQQLGIISKIEQIQSWYIQNRAPLDELLARDQSNFSRLARVYDETKPYDDLEGSMVFGNEEVSAFSVMLSNVQDTTRSNNLNETVANSFMGHFAQTRLQHIGDASLSRDSRVELWNYLSEYEQFAQRLPQRDPFTEQMLNYIRIIREPQFSSGINEWLQQDYNPEGRNVTPESLNPLLERLGISAPMVFSESETTP